MYLTQRLARWVYDFAGRPIDGVTGDRLRAILLDGLGCALAAIGTETPRHVLATVDALGGAPDCTIIGMGRKTSLPLAVLANSTLIRALDFNDVYSGPGQMGHPSDNLAVALAAAELGNRSGADLLAAIRLCYEVYGRVLDLFDPATTGWDNVTASGLAGAATAGWLLRLPEDRLAHALALAAAHCHALRGLRAGPISAAKSFANGIVLQTATTLTLLARAGLTGPAQSIEGRHGFAATVLGGATFERFFDDDDAPPRVLRTSFKLFPCFALAQGPIAAAIALRERYGGPPSALDRIEVIVADSPIARMRLGDGSSRVPDSREAADHNLAFLVAVALLDGRVDLGHFDRKRWLAADVAALIARIEPRIDSTMDPGPPSSYPCQIVAHLSGGQTIALDLPIAPGHFAAPPSAVQMREKFLAASASILSGAAQASVIDMIERIDAFETLDPLLHLLDPHSTIGAARTRN